MRPEPEGVPLRECPQCRQLPRMELSKTLESDLWSAVCSCMESMKYNEAVSIWNQTIDAQMAQVETKQEESPEERAVRRGSESPYDGECLDDSSAAQSIIPSGTDTWPYKAVRGILYDMCDRLGIKQELYSVDPYTRREMVVTLASIIGEAHKQGECS